MKAAMYSCAMYTAALTVAPPVHSFTEQVDRSTSITSIPSVQLNSSQLPFLPDQCRVHACLQAALVHVYTKKNTSKKRKHWYTSRGLAVHTTKSKAKAWTHGCETDKRITTVR